MFNNRMLAVAAVLAMAIPALGAAAPIVVPPVPEQLVEGHTVFTVIEIARRNDTVTERFAAAVAVLVREYSARQVADRFPGVLWFNDQYLVDPELSQVRVNKFRHPCGGAVMAVNAGDPDPRVVMARVAADGAVLATAGPSRNARLVGLTETSNPLFGSDYGSDYAWVGADVDTANPANSEVYSDTVLGSVLNSGGVLGGYDYEESYLITDPNDHSWVIDKYNFYTRDGTSGLNTATNTLGAGVYSYNFPVWVVNILGSPVFIPDTGSVAFSFGPNVGSGNTRGPLGENCAPFKDLLPSPVNNYVPPFRDDPVMGYQEPSRNGYCYGGQEEAVAPVGCDHTYPNKPLRLYNALLYFKLEDLYVAGADKDHSDPVGDVDTNGCQVGTEWTCPGWDGNTPGGPWSATGDDNAEGNSHPFHPNVPPHVHGSQSCVGTVFDGPNPTNHGGSTNKYPHPYGLCDYDHATRNIDVYFSPAGRPFEPLLRNFDIIDLEGSTAPFYDFHSAHAGVP